MPRILVLADDLTGASDAGAQFAKHGIPTYVLTHWQFAALGSEEDTGVVVINTESRHMTPDDAFSTVTKLAKAAKALGIKTIYKKTDSTLRGNIGSEIEAVMKASGNVSLVYIPAFPDAHRFIRDGVLYVEDKPVTETSFADDILSPVRHSYLPDVISEQSKIPCQVVSLSMLRQNVVDFRQPGYLFIVDGETNADLRQTATILRNQGITGCFAGAAAFAEHLIKLLELPTVPLNEPEIHSPVMVVNGSVNPVSLAQLRHGLTHGYVPCQLTPEMLFPAPDASTDGSFERQVGHACDVLARGEHLLVHTARTEAETHAYIRVAESCGTSRHDVPQRLLTSVAQFVRDVVGRTRMRTLMVFGGETAYTTLRALGCQRARVLKEISVGANVLETEVLNRRVQLITKSGGFGTPAFLEDFLTCLLE